MSDQSIRSQGIHGSGTRDWTQEQYDRVVRFIRLPGGPVTVEEVSNSTGVPGRAVRDIVSAADGVEFLLGGSGNGYRLATDEADANRLTARFASQARKMIQRVNRRRAYAGRHGFNDGTV